MTDKFLRIENVEQTFRTRHDPFVTLRGINLTVARGEYIALIGHSGCDKSTLLNLIAGLIRPVTGGLILAERGIAGPGPDQAVVFQSHSLLPWFTCSDNVYLAVERVFGKSETKAWLRDRTYAALTLIDLSHAEQKYPHEVSGGMRQCIGIARVLSMEPKVLLVGEPPGTLDALTRAHLQDELLKIVAATGNTVMMITYDVGKAVLLVDRTVIMTNGPAATIGEVLTVDLLWPRDRMALTEDPIYYACRAAVLDFLYRKRRHPVAETARFAVGMVLLLYLGGPSPISCPGRG